MTIDLSFSPYGATHYNHRDGHTWFYKKENGRTFFPSSNGWTEIRKGIDINHDKWLECNLKEISEGFARNSDEALGKQLSVYANNGEHK